MAFNIVISTVFPIGMRISAITYVEYPNLNLQQMGQRSEFGMLENAYFNYLIKIDRGGILCGLNYPIKLKIPLENAN
jgi:hypothetical protein